MPFGGAWFFDEEWPCPVCTLWQQLLAAFTQAVGFLCARRFMVWEFIRRRVLAKVREKCMWPHATALVIVGIPGSVLSMMIYLLAVNLSTRTRSLRGATRLTRRCSIQMTALNPTSRGAT